VGFQELITLVSGLEAAPGEDRVEGPENARGLRRHSTKTAVASLPQGVNSVPSIRFPEDEPPNRFVVSL